MDMLQYYGSLLLRALPLPIHAPTSPDLWYCNPEYGQNLIPLDCQIAVDNNWPSGRTNVHYYTMDPSPSNGIRVPRSDRHGISSLIWGGKATTSLTSAGTCQVSIETAGPDLRSRAYSIAPNYMRALAGFVIETCANQAGGIGGFVTHGFGAAENYIAGIANDADEHMSSLASKSVA